MFFKIHFTYFSFFISRLNNLKMQKFLAHFKNI